MQVPQKYILLGLGVLVLFVFVLHRLSRNSTVPAAEQAEQANDWIDEKDPITGV